MGRRGPRDRFLDDAMEEAVFEIAEDVHETERVNLLSERFQEQVDISALPVVPRSGTL
jgi:hypothetical protein